MLRKSRWYWLIALLVALVLFDLFAVPRIAVYTLERGRGEVFTVSSGAN